MAQRRRNQLRVSTDVHRFHHPFSALFYTNRAPFEHLPIVFHSGRQVKKQASGWSGMLFTIEDLNFMMSSLSIDSLIAALRAYKTVSSQFTFLI